ncbi:MAG: 50S ribosomal protein L4 [Syntrophales bacterium]|jgi:large subunit ribosomal protein L4|nr:50S ribosomal protein L4 [Syntrophales bacterium]MCK9527863.1 50S ribosomal protein L4 [Syntrophales bacterium]MDX9921963.1 50S ribosomal protein L4 [Syntrophales bacterium]
MALQAVYDINRNEVGEVDLDDRVFAVPVNTDVIYEVVTMQRAQRRSGTASTKRRGDVHGGGKKPWRQKGTGRARAGTIRSPLWKGGGVVFGPHPRSYSFKVPRKVRKAALKSALSMKLKENQLIILREFPMEEIRTKRFKEVMDRFELAKTLFVLDREDTVLDKSSRNIPDVKMMRAEGINVYDLLRYDTVVLMEPSVKMIEGALLS